MGETGGVKNGTKLSHKGAVEGMWKLRKQVKPGKMSAG